MGTKNIIYIVLIIISLLASLSILVLYYTQNFDEEFDFKETLNTQSVEIQSNSRGQEKYLGSAKGTLGTLTLENQGIFPQVYTLPQLIGCIDLNPDVTQQDSKIRNFQFQITYLQEGIRSNTGQKIEIPKGKEEEFTLIGEYSSYDVPLKAFSTDSIKSLSLYRLPQDQRNPLSEGGYNYKRSIYGDNCNTIRTELKRVAVMPLT